MEIILKLARFFPILRNFYVFSTSFPPLNEFKTTMYFRIFHQYLIISIEFQISKEKSFNKQGSTLVETANDLELN